MSARRPSVRAWIELAGVGLLAAAITWSFFRPSPAELWSTLPAHGGAYADAVLLAWAIGHVSRSLFGLAAPLFDAPIFHPARHTLAFGDHMIGQAALGLPIWQTTGNPVLEYNLLHLASFPAAALALFAYLRRGVRLPFCAALAGGFAFAFTPYRFHSPLWLQVLWTAFVPLALLAWLDFVRGGRRGAWLLWVACWAFHSMLGLYLALYFGIVMTALAAYAALAAPSRREPRRRLGLLAGPFATALLVAPTLLPYVQLRAEQGNVRHGGLGTSWTFFLPHQTTATTRVLDLHAAPGWFGPGIVAWLLALVGVVLAVRALLGRTPRRDPDEAFTAGAHLLGLGIALALVLLPITWQQLVPGLDMVRVTNRAHFIALAFFGTLVGAGAAWLCARGPGWWRGAAAIAIAAAVVLDSGVPPRERKAIATPPDLPEAIAALAALPPEAVVYEHVFGPDQLALSMYHGLFHGHAIPTGWSGFFTPGASFANVGLFAFPNQPALEAARRLGVAYVWQHFRTAEQRETFERTLPPGLQAVARPGTDLVLDIADAARLAVPPADDARPVLRDRWRLAGTAEGDVLAVLRDGDATTVWEYTAIDPLRRTTVTIDLGEPARVAAVIVRTPRGLGDAIAVAQLEVSRDGERWEAFAGFLPEPFETFFTAPPAILTLAARDAPHEARFLRVGAAGASAWAGPWRIGELEVLAAPR